MAQKSRTSTWDGKLNNENKNKNEINPSVRFFSEPKTEKINNFNKHNKQINTLGNNTTPVTSNNKAIVVVVAVGEVVGDVGP